LGSASPNLDFPLQTSLTWWNNPDHQGIGDADTVDIDMITAVT